MNQQTPRYDDPQRGPATPEVEPAPQPVRVSIPRSAPYVTYGIIAITVFFYVLQLASQFLLQGQDLPAALLLKDNDAIELGQWWRLLTPALMHGSIMHIAFNMYALLSFGTGLESHFGHGRFFLLYILSAFAGNVASFLMTPADSLGASTAVFGLLGAEGIFLYQNRRLFAGQFRSAIGNILFIAAINLALGFASPNIDNAGHIGGLLGGLMFTWFAGPLWEVEGISPALRLEDQRPGREVLVGAVLVIAIFGGLVIWGLTR